MTKHRTIDDTVYFWFGANDTNGSGGDGASAAADVRLAGAAASAAPILSPAPTLLTDAGYPDGCYEVAVEATTGNGFASGSEYAVFCTLAIDSQNPTGFVGSFILDPIIANVKELVDSTQSATDLKDFADDGYDPSTNKVQGVVLVDTTTANTDMAGTDDAALASDYTTARAGYLDNINGHTPQTGDSYARLGAPTGASVSADVASVQADTTSILARIGDYAGTGLNSIKGFLQAALRSDAGVTGANTPSEINEIENGTTGDYDGATEAQEAIRGRGDAAWDTATGFSTFDPATDTVATVTGVTNDVGITQAGADKVWSSATRTLSAAGVQAIWDALTAALTTADSIGKLLVDNINAAISSRATSANVATELATYDGPTKAEMDARTLVAANYFDPTNDEVDLGKIKGTALTETNAGDVAESFSSFYDVDPVTTKTVDDVGAGGGGLTQQQVRDAMKLAPTGGAPTAGSVDEHLDDIMADTNELQADWANGGRLDNILDARSNHSAADVWAAVTRTLTAFSFGVTVTTNSDKTNYALSATNRQAMVDDILDEVISKSAHNDPNSVGKYIRRIGVAFIWEGTAQGPGTGSNQIQLDTGASSVSGAYDPASVSIVDGTGAGQSRLALQYDGPTRTMTVDRDWKVNPDATSEFIITPHAGRGHVNEGLAQDGTANTITLNSLASSVGNVYARQRIFIVSGTGADQVGRGVSYNGATKVLTVAQTWDTIPDTTSGYVMLPDAPSLFQGYESAAIWLDTVNGTAGTVLYENGTAENPSDSLADATTLATNLGFSEIRVAPGSSLTLAQSYNGFTIGSISSNGWTLNLGGQSISSTTIIGATVSGVCSGANKPTFISCSMGAVTIPASRILNCAIIGTQTMSGTGDFFYEGCYSGIAGTSMWDIIFSASSNLNLRHYSGGVQAQSMAATNNMSLEGNGQLVINANCTGGTIAIRGHFTVTDNSSGAVTLSDDARIDIGQINAQADQALTDYDPPTNTQMNARTLLAASYATAAAQATMQADLDNPNQYKADVSALALEATVATLNDISVADILTTQMVESYAANGVAPTLAQALFQIQQSIGEFSISGVTITARKIDGTTTAFTYTLNDSIDPTSRTRAT